MNDPTRLRPLPSAPPEDRLAAYFQPILALDTRRIVSYEVLGRQVDGDSVRSLGPFFTDPRVPTEDQVRVDRLLREQAVAKVAALEEPPVLFINLKPSWMYRRREEADDLHTLRLLDRYKVDPRNICIEITEEEFQGPIGELLEVIDVYRARGCRIAIDDVGSGFSNFDRIAQIRPHLLKTDILLMKRSASHDGYLGVLRSFSTLAEQIGASLLVEGVETRDDLTRAIQIGARYVQGYLFAPAEPQFRARDEFAPLIAKALAEHKARLEDTENRWRLRSCRLADSARESGLARRIAGLFPDAAGACGAAGEREAELARAEATVQGAAADTESELDTAGMQGAASREDSANAADAGVRDERGGPDGRDRLESARPKKGEAERPLPVDEAIADWLPRLDESVLRAFLCRTDGVQLSSNHLRDERGDWRREADYVGANWSWRPYFIPHLLGANRTESQLSPRYADLDTHAWIRTISIPLGRDLVLFLDIADEEA